jgi:hypothetical protein
MGNSIYRFLCGVCSGLSDAAFTPHGAHDSVAALGRDILNFQRTKQVRHTRALRAGLLR